MNITQIVNAAKQGWANDSTFPELLLRRCLTVAIEGERESCAKVCDDLAYFSGEVCADNIRARVTE